MNKLLACVLVLLLASGGAFAGEPTPESALREELKVSINHGLTYLKEQQKEGTWMKHPGITALALIAFLDSEKQYRPADGPFIRLPVDYLLSQQDGEGAFYDAASANPTKNYVTSLVLRALTLAGPKEYAAQIAKARAYLARLMCDEGEGYTPDKDYFYGGIGYGGDLRPDLSNTQLALEALFLSGGVEESVAKKAQIFLRRCQDYEGNDQSWAKRCSGGFAYSPDLPSRKAKPDPKEASEEIVPYGSMTFAGLKSLVFCGVTSEDPRYTEAWDWVRKNYAVDHHPRMGQQALYYYFDTMARTLSLLKADRIELPSGQKADWRMELGKELLRLQHKDGSWVNEEGKYMEGLPVLATAYALSALNHINRALLK
ncbi:MAG: hypothetical protein HQL31_04480 [Planctomycetes bacterium]|nr:hypothetical protein [Planctomycetota bacterium]